MTEIKLSAFFFFFKSGDVGGADQDNSYSNCYRMEKAWTELRVKNQEDSYSVKKRWKKEARVEIYNLIFTTVLEDRELYTYFYR